MEELITIMLSEGASGKKYLLINEQTYELIDGVCSVHLSDLTIPKDKSLREFDQCISQWISTPTIKKEFYRLFINNSKLGIGEIMRCLGMEKQSVKQLLSIGLKYNVIQKSDSQYKAVNKDKMRKFLYLTYEKQDHVETPIDELIKDKDIEKKKEKVKK